MYLLIGLNVVATNAGEKNKEVTPNTVKTSDKVVKLPAINIPATNTKLVNKPAKASTKPKAAIVATTIHEGGSA